MQKRFSVERAEHLRQEGQALLASAGRFPAGLGFVPVEEPAFKRVFDQALDEIHYAGACRRVGRLLRLAVLLEGRWVGGIVLGSTFPNIRPRDEAFGLTRFLRDFRERGLLSPWARENHAYWSALQRIVNHARTFIFPSFQGKGLGIMAHRLLLTEGIRLWEARYGGPVLGLDTLCTHDNSRLFAENGWQLVGRTQGYTRDPQKVFSKRAFAQEWKNISDNAGLGMLEGSTRWWIWVNVLRPLDGG